ncbi:MAG: DNA adenine methylase [Deltaproteobacteria bacterium]|nr:DNA adenine methylase [Deltaproteobacteria bacterium]
MAKVAVIARYAGGKSPYARAIARVLGRVPQNKFFYEVFCGMGTVASEMIDLDYACFITLVDANPATWAVHECLQNPESYRCLRKTHVSLLKSPDIIRDVTELLREYKSVWENAYRKSMHGHVTRLLRNTDKIGWDETCRKIEEVRRHTSRDFTAGFLEEFYCQGKEEIAARMGYARMIELTFSRRTNLFDTAEEILYEIPALKIHEGLEHLGKRIARVHVLRKQAAISTSQRDAVETISGALPDSVVFLDPPYSMKKRNKSYGKYQFTHDDHRQLASALRARDEDIRWLMTMDDEDATHEIYADFPRTTVRVRHNLGGLRPEVWIGPPREEVLIACKAEGGET